RQRRHHRLDQPRAGQQPRLRRRHREALQRRANLRDHQIDRHRRPRRHARAVLRGDRRDRRPRVPAQIPDRAPVRLHPRAPAAVRTGDGQDAGRRGADGDGGHDFTTRTLDAPAARVAPFFHSSTFHSPPRLRSTQQIAKTAGGKTPPPASRAQPRPYKQASCPTAESPPPARSPRPAGAASQPSATPSAATTAFPTKPDAVSKKPPRTWAGGPIRSPPPSWPTCAPPGPLATRPPSPSRSPTPPARAWR